MDEQVKVVESCIWNLKKDPITVAGKPCKVYVVGYAAIGLVAARYAFWEGVLMKEEINETGFGGALKTMYEVKKIELVAPNSAFEPSFSGWF